jgi:hypothetical protein
MQNADPLLLIVAALAAACVLSARRSVRQTAGLAAATFALGHASLDIALELAGATDHALALRALRGFAFRTDAALEVIGVGLAVSAAVLAWRAERREGEMVAAALSIGAASAMLFIAAPHARAAGPFACLGIAAVLTAVGMIVLGAVDRIPNAVRPPRLPGPVPRPALVTIGIGGALVVAAPHLYAVIGGAIGAALAAQWIARTSGGSRIPLLPLLAIPALGFVAYYMQVIAAPIGLSLEALRNGPFSPAAESMLIVPLALGAIGYFGLWPLHRLLPGPALAVIGVALLVRLGAGVLPEGLAAWRTVFVPAGVIALWGAAARRRPELVAAAFAWMACFAPASGGAEGAWLVAGAALAGAVLTGAMPVDRARSDRLRLPLRIAAAVAGGTGAALALAGLLRAEVVYAVLAWAGVATAVYIWRAE